MSRMAHISAPWHLPVRRYESRKSVFEAKKECIYTLVYQGLIEGGGGGGGALRFPLTPFTICVHLNGSQASTLITPHWKEL